jgi:hypothetical protein
MKLTFTEFAHAIFRRYAFQIILVFLLLGGRAASAQSCIVDGPRYNLIEDTVGWSIKVASGRSCVLGVRFANVKIESVKLDSPPQSGQIALQGPGFKYSAKADFVGEDSFALAVNGAINNQRGSSTIHVSVSVVGPPRKLADPGSVGLPPAPAEILQAPRQSAIDNDAPLPVGTTLPPCPIWDWSNGASPPPMRPPFDRSKLYCPPSPFKPPNPPVGCICPE